VRDLYLKQAQAFDEKIAALPRSWDAGRAEARRRLQDLQTSNASLIDIKAANRALSDYPKSPEAARRLWERQRDNAIARAQPLQPHTQAFAGSTQAASDIQRNNFLALVFCLMLGTAALPHVLVRSCPPLARYRTAHASRCFWALAFILAAVYRATCACGPGQI
jgi:cation/acetate symporter